MPNPLVIAKGNFFVTFIVLLVIVALFFIVRYWGLLFAKAKIVENKWYDKKVGELDAEAKRNIKN